MTKTKQILTFNLNRLKASKLTKTASLTAVVILMLGLAYVTTKPQAISSNNGLIKDKPISTCQVPANMSTMTGIVMTKYSDYSAFVFSSGNKIYLVKLTAYTAGGTQVINLRCRQTPIQFIQTADQVTVTGDISATADSSSGGYTKEPVYSVNAKVVQVKTVKDE